MLTAQNRLGTRWPIAHADAVCWTCWRKRTSRDLCCRPLLMPLTDVKLLEQLRKLPEEGNVPWKASRDGAAPDHHLGRHILVGGKGKNVYELDKLPDVCAVIDLGGDDEYYEEGTVSPDPGAGDPRPGGQRHLSRHQPGIQGGAVLGVSMLLDRQGNDTYQARDVAQGSALGGSASLSLGGGSHAYRGLRRVQGAALGGFGLLLDRSGKNDTTISTPPCGARVSAIPSVSACSTTWAARITTTSADVSRLLIRKRRATRAGARVWAPASASRPTGASACSWMAAATTSTNTTTWPTAAATGWALGLPATSAATTAASAGPTKFTTVVKRTRARLPTIACGWGCHYALGFCFDDAGNDTYGGTIMGLGFAWDMSVGVLCDFAGNDRIRSRRGQTQGCGAQGPGYSVRLRGRDVYLGQTRAMPLRHLLPLESACGGNFSFSSITAARTIRLRRREQQLQPRQCSQALS